MRILTIYDNFSYGGVEDQIKGQAHVLAHHGVEMFLAAGNSLDEVASGVFRDTIGELSLSPHTTFPMLRETLAQLDDFVRLHAITAIHAHPFFSSIVGALVAQKANLPYALTMHGPLSLNSMKGPVLELLFRAAVLPAAGTVFCVSRETELLCQASAASHTKVLPNAVNIPEEIIEPASSLTGPWMWAGRLDQAKAAGLRDLISKMIGMGQLLHVYGEGSAQADLADFLRMGGDALRFVELRGWHDALPDAMRDYRLVAGMGRVILEAAIRDRACLLVGYDGVKGLLDLAALERSALWNHSGRGSATIDRPEFAAQLAKWHETPNDYRLSEWVRQERSGSAVWKQFLSEFPINQPTRDPTLATVLDALLLQGDTCTEVWNSVEFASLLKGLFSTLSVVDKRRRRVEQEQRDRRLVDTIEKSACGIGSLQAALNAGRQEIASLQAALEAGTREITSLQQATCEEKQRAAIAESARNYWRDVAHTMRNSRSWRLTAPARQVTSAGRTLLGRLLRAAGSADNTRVPRQDRESDAE